MKKKFKIQELDRPVLALKQGCSCGGSVVVKKEALASSSKKTVKKASK